MYLEISRRIFTIFVNTFQETFYIGSASIDIQKPYAFAWKSNSSESNDTFNHAFRTLSLSVLRRVWKCIFAISTNTTYWLNNAQLSIIQTLYKVSRNSLGFNQGLY